MLPGNNTLNYNSSSQQQSASNSNSANVSKGKLAGLRAKSYAPTVMEQFRANLNDPEILARLADEERRKRAGGGGGGSFRKSFKPYVDFSFLLMAYLSDQAKNAYAALVRADKNPVLDFAQNAAAQVQNFVANLADKTKQLLQNGINRMLMIFTNPQNLKFDPIKAAKNLVHSFANAATVSMSALANKLYKLIFGNKDEELDIKERNQEEEIEDSGFLSNLKDFFSGKNSDMGNSAKNIFAHIEKIANQLTRNFKF